MTNQELQQRAFILSSFSRLGIPITTTVYRFCDYTIKSNWQPKLDCLNNVDQEVKSKYEQFINQ